MLLALLLVGASACQKTEGSRVQPEKLASSSPALSSGTAPRTGAPFAPFASGYGPEHVAKPAVAPKASGGAPVVDEFNPDGPSVAPSKPPPAKPTTSKPNPGVVKLVKAGAKPRRQLRFAPKVGDAAAVEMVMTTEINMEIDGKKPPSGQVPPIVFVIATKVTGISAEGDIRYTFSVSEAGVRAMPGVRAEVITALNQALGALVGLKGTVLLSSRGITKETQLSLPGKPNAQTAQVLQGMEQAMQQLGAPLPEEAVGRGARWTHTTSMSQNGISLTQVATYSLTKVSGNKLTCKIALTQSAPKQKVASPVGVTVDLLSLESKGRGTTKIRLDQLMPVKSKMLVTTRAQMGLPKGQKMKMDSKLTVEMGTPKKRPARSAKPPSGKVKPGSAATVPSPAPKPAKPPTPRPAPAAAPAP